MKYVVVPALVLVAFWAGFLIRPWFNGYRDDHVAIKALRKWKREEYVPFLKRGLRRKGDGEDRFDDDDGLQ